MPKFRLNVSIEQKGAIFNASTTHAAGKRMVIRVNEALAVEGVKRVLIRLKQVLQHPMGFYQSRITVDRRAVYRGIWDQNVVYGGWLEGVSSRNATTRFKGYRTFRMVRQSIEQDKVKLAQPAVATYIKEMNGS